jgi:hypothetical protein
VAARTRGPGRHRWAAGTGAATTLGDLLSSSLDTVGERQLDVLRELVRPQGSRTVGDLALALHRPQHEIVEDLSVLIGRGLVHAPTGEAAAQLRVPNLLRAVLLRPEPPPPARAPDTAAETDTETDTAADTAAYAWR